MVVKFLVEVVNPGHIGHIVPDTINAELLSDGVLFSFATTDGKDIERIEICIYVAYRFIGSERSDRSECHILGKIPVELNRNTGLLNVRLWINILCLLVIIKTVSQNVCCSAETSEGADKIQWQDKARARQITRWRNGPSSSQEQCGRITRAIV